MRGGDAPVGSGDDGVAALVSVVVAESVLVDQRQHLAPALVVDDPAALLRIVLISFIYFPLFVGQFLGMAKFAGVSEGAPLAEEPLARPSNRA